MDWEQAYGELAPPAVDSRKRLRLMLWAFVAVLLAVFLRAAHFQYVEGAAFRDEALKPQRRTTEEQGRRGPIVSADGVVLAETRDAPALAVSYRLLQEPADRAWLRRMARGELARADRRNAAKIAAAEAAVLERRAALHRRLAKACGVSEAEWQQRRTAIDRRVQRIAALANARVEAAARDATAAAEPTSFWGKVARAIGEALDAARDEPPDRVVVAEELDYHVLCDDLPAGAAAALAEEVRENAGVKIVQIARRTYPQRTLAAHALGHLGPAEERPDALRRNAPRRNAPRPAALVGRMGLERQYEQALCGADGVRVEMTDRGGRTVSGYWEREPATGCTLRLTLDSRLQRTAEELLDAALARREALGCTEPGGGAIVALDAHSGAILAAASAPRFDPNWFAARENAEIAKAFAAPARPMFDRTVQMAIPPGSVFKTLTAAALLESDTVHAEDPFTCQGYWRTPDRQRCELFVRRGVGHGKVDLLDALAVSCNVYFFEHAAVMGPAPLVAWAERFGFGRATCVDLPGEAAGAVPTAESLETSDSQAMAIGQGTLTVTPMQIARLMAAVANGGVLVAPHLAVRLDPAGNAGPDAAPPLEIDPPLPVPGLHASTLKAIREGLRRVVESPRGSAHATVFLESLPIAGKTGTAETGGGRSSHAWFAGYAPADRPKVAFVVALEHSGAGATAAGPVAQRLVMAMRELGLIE